MKKIKAITIKDNEQFLRQISRPVDFNDSDLTDNIETLHEFCKDNEVLAMAAVQLGIPKRIIYIKNTDLNVIKRRQENKATEADINHNESRVLINPVIKESEGLTEYWEACASCLDNTGLVKRPYKIVVEYQDINGKIHEDTFEGFESTVLSHEMDHLDGILHIDIAEKVLVMSADERREYRKTHDYKIISKTENYKKLIKKK